MAEPALDWARFARQIALAEVGVAGQSRLGTVGLRFVGHPDVVGLAAMLHTRAGGLVDPGAAATVSVGDAPPASAPERLGRAALAALEAARAVLDGPAAPDPSPFLSRLSLSPSAR